MRYRLRTLMIVLALGPIVAWQVWPSVEHRYKIWRLRRDLKKFYDRAGSAEIYPPYSERLEEVENALRQYEQRDGR